VGTKKISQLDTISDANISGEAILPVVVSDPLIPNRKAKVNQLFKGVSQGTKDAPGLSFDLDRDTGIYQNQYNEFGITFGDGGFYYSRIVNSSTSASLYITALDDSADNADIVLSPKGTGVVKVTGTFLLSDQTFILEDAQGPKARFEVSTIGSGTGTRVINLPTITSGNSTTLVGADTQQTLTNKTILIDEDNFVIVDGTEEAIFQINWPTTSGTRRSYFLPDPGPVTTTAEPTATASTLLDTKTEQIAISKTFVNLKVASDAEVDTPWVQFDTSSASANRTIVVPDFNLTLVGLESTQTITNKTYRGAIIADNTDPSKRITFNLSSSNTSTNSEVGFPPTNLLNTTGTNVIVTELATQTLSSKTLVSPNIKTGISNNVVTLDTSNITGSRTIRFPDADATLLSTENVTVEDVNFGAGIGGANLTGRTRQQQFFYAGF